LQQLQQSAAQQQQKDQQQHQQPQNQPALPPSTPSMPPLRPSAPALSPTLGIPKPHIPPGVLNAFGEKPASSSSGSSIWGGPLVRVIRVWTASANKGSCLLCCM
jgi:hypothetical protein